MILLQIKRKIGVSMDHDKASPNYTEEEYANQEKNNIAMNRLGRMLDEHKNEILNLIHRLEMDKNKYTD